MQYKPIKWQRSCDDGVSYKLRSHEGVDWIWKVGFLWGSALFIKGPWFSISPSCSFWHCMWGVCTKLKWFWKCTACLLSTGRTLALLISLMLNTCKLATSLQQIGWLALCWMFDGIYLKLQRIKYRCISVCEILPLRKTPFLSSDEDGNTQCCKGNS